MSTEKQYPISIANDEVLLDVLSNLASTAADTWPLFSQKPFAADECIPTSVALFYKQYLLNNSFTLASFKEFSETACRVTDASSKKELGDKSYSSSVANSVVTYLTKCFGKLNVEQNQLLSFQADGIYIDNEKVANLNDFLTEDDIKIFSLVIPLPSLKTKPSLEKLTDAGLESAFNAYDEHMNFIQSAENSLNLGLLSAEMVFVNLKDNSGNEIKADDFISDSKKELNDKIKEELNPITNESKENIINLIEESKKKFLNPLNHNQLEFLQKLQKDGSMSTLLSTLELCKKFGLTELEKSLKEEFKNSKNSDESCEKIISIMNESSAVYDEPNNLSKKFSGAFDREGRDHYINYIKTIHTAIEHCDAVLNSNNIPSEIKADYESLKNDLIQEKSTLNKVLQSNLNHCSNNNYALNKISLSLCQSAIGESAQRCAKLYEDKIVNNPKHNSFTDFLLKGNVIFQALVTLGEKILGKNSIRHNKDIAASHREELKNFGQHALFGNNAQASPAAHQDKQAAEGKGPQKDGPVVRWGSFR